MELKSKTITTADQAFIDLLKEHILFGTGSPIDSVVADIGTIYLRNDGGTNTTLYVKESDSGLSSGWVAK